MPYVGTFLRCLYEKPRGMANDFSFDVKPPQITSTPNGSLKYWKTALKGQDYFKMSELNRTTLKRARNFLGLPSAIFSWV